MTDEWDNIIEGSKKLDLEGVASNSALSTRRRRERCKDQFVIVPMAWVRQLQKASGTSTYRLALYLLFCHWKNGGSAITGSNLAVAEAGISRRQKWRALTELEHLGLIHLERRGGRSPMVTVLFPGECKS
jgi:hypothetical protein